MFHQKKWISAVVVGASFIFALSAAPAIAHGPGHDDDHDHGQCKHCEEKMAKMDADGDGKISRREYMKHHGDMFDKHDLNNDRFLDADELHYMMEDMHKNMHEGHHGHGEGHGHSHDDDDHNHEHSHGEDQSHKHSHDHD